MNTESSWFAAPNWLVAQGVHLIDDCRVTAFEHTTLGGQFTVTAVDSLHQGGPDVMAIKDGDSGGWELGMPGRGTPAIRQT
jgi:hypothetical protein